MPQPEPHQIPTPACPMHIHGHQTMQGSILAPYMTYPPHLQLHPPTLIPSSSLFVHKIQQPFLPPNLNPPFPPAPPQTVLPMALQLNPFSNWEWIPTWKCPMTGALWTPTPILLSATPTPTLGALEIPPALGFWIPFLANLLHQNLDSFHPATSQGGAHVGNTAPQGMDLPPASSAAGNHLGTPLREEGSTDWLQLPGDLDDAMLIGTGLLQDIINSATPAPPWPCSKSQDRT